MAIVEWVEPALLWNSLHIEQINRPRLLHIRSDDFMPEFLAAMASRDPYAPPSEYLAEHALPAHTVETLYQPLHGSFYLVTASLVCRQLGLPDRAIDPKNGERTLFVIRRIRDGYEQGWVETEAFRGWQSLDDPKSLLPGEERFPMHPVSTSPGGPSLANGYGRMPCDERVIYHGYLPTGNRKKYIEAYMAPTPSGAVATPADNAALVDNYRRQIEQDSSLEDFRLNEFDTRVLSTWSYLKDMHSQGDPSPDAARLNDMSLYLVLDLGDYLSKALPGVWWAIAHNNSAGLSAVEQDLVDTLEGVTILVNGVSTALTDALRDRQDDLELVGGGDGPLPSDQYSFWGVPIPSNLKARVKAALAAEDTPMQVTQEMADLLRTQVRVAPVAADGQPADYYFLRLAYEYDPECPPVVSEPSQYFRLAGYMDPDAPARPIRLELPSIKMRDLRRFKRGVGFEMSPDLRRVMDGVHKGLLEGAGLNSSEGWSLAMICSFSLQIIFLVAFIVMFIFLILLNIVFWWLPFLKICFPIPKPPSS